MDQHKTTLGEFNTIYWNKVFKSQAAVSAQIVDHVWSGRTMIWSVLWSVQYLWCNNSFIHWDFHFPCRHDILLLNQTKDNRIETFQSGTWSIFQRMTTYSSDYWSKSLSLQSQFPSLWAQTSHHLLQTEFFKKILQNFHSWLAE